MLGSLYVLLELVTYNFTDGVPPTAKSAPIDALLDTVSVLLIVCAPVRANVDPLNVRLPLSSISPEAPAITTRLFVRSDTLRLLTVALLETLSVPPTLRLVPT